MKYKILSVILVPVLLFTTAVAITATSITPENLEAINYAIEPPEVLSLTDDVASQTPECAGIVVPVTIDPEQEAGKLDERYLGFTIDTAQLTDIGFWGSDEAPDLENPKLRKITSYLAPSRFRFGGTDADGVYYCSEEGNCTPPQSYQDGMKGDDPAIFLTREDIRQILNFAEAVGARIMFCINMGPGPRNSSTGEWIPDNARELIQYVNSLPNGHLVDIWEAGNEVNILGTAYDMPKYLSAQLYSSDLSTFRALIDEEDPECLVAAPSCFFAPFAIVRDFNFTQNVLNQARDTIDLVTWHLYATQSDRCDAIASPNPANKENLFDESIVDMHRTFAEYVETAADGLPVINGETASAQCGGQAGVSDTLLDALWFADWIGIMAEEGSSSVVRSTIVGLDYGLLDPETYDPRPSFLAYVMFRRTVERYRLKTTADRSLIKAHAFCSAGINGNVTAVLSNPSENMITAEIALEDTTVLSARQWTIGAEGDLTATRATIEGQSHLPDGTIPDPPGTVVQIENGKAYAQVEPNSLVFVVMEPLHKSGLCDCEGTPAVPTIITSAASDVTAHTVTLNATLDDLGTASNVEVTFQWGHDTKYGRSTTAQWTDTTGPLTAELTNLAPNTTYHFRAVARGHSRAYSDDMTFSTGSSSFIPEIAFLDSFEIDLGRWNDNGGTHWFLTGLFGQKHDGSQSIKADIWHNKGGTLTSDDIDLSDAEAATLSFWFRKTATDPEDYTLYFYDGTDYNLISELDTYGADNTWLPYTITIDLDTYKIPNFRICFDATLEGFLEICDSVWLDELRLTKWTTQCAFSDHFEDGLSQWVGNWQLHSDERHDGVRSVRADQTHDDPIQSAEIDLSGATSATLDFWFRKSGTEGQDFSLYFWDGTEGIFPTGWNLIAELDTLGADSTWLHYSAPIDLDTYGISNFRLMFDSDLGLFEYTWVDQLTIEITTD